MSKIRFAHGVMNFTGIPDVLGRVVMADTTIKKVEAGRRREEKWAKKIAWW